MSRIHPLDPIVINKIAAGEVIERPASVVKELLENSLDALSTQITIEIQQGGAELIRIVDDGEGIHPDDLLLAVTSHATSKITTDEDLFSVHTMGFRGEALASIASVSQVRIRSRQEDSPSGWELAVNGGHIGTPQPCGCPVGTQIEVRNLFGNTPVRRKFLKTQSTEFSHISEQFTRIAIANPRLHLSLRHNDKMIYELPPTTHLADRLTLFYGSELADKLLRVESEHNGVRLWGYVGHPSQTKSTRKGQYLFLNGRYIQDRSLQHALSEAYRGLVMVGRHPISFLFLELPPKMVDVNVHPTKAEVRFRDSQQLYRQLLSTLRTTFLSNNLDSVFKLPEPKSDLPPHPQENWQKELVDWSKQELANWKPTETIGGTPPVVNGKHSGTEHVMHAPSVNPPHDPIPAQEAGSVPPHFQNLSGSTSGDSAPDTSTDAQSYSPPVTNGHPDQEPDLAHGTWHRVLQVQDCYLVTETDKGLMVIDQHALHERILYEQLRQRILAGSVESQRLLVPETVELSAREAACLIEQSELLHQLGFGLEEFGKNTILVNAYPLMLKKNRLESMIRDLAERLDQAGSQVTRRDLLDSLMHMMACKAAIKSGQRLTPEEIDSLLALRHLVEDSHHCPHGRPTALVLSRSELDRQFGRLG